MTVGASDADVEADADCEMSDLSLSRRRMGARDRKLKKTSLRMISGEVRTDVMVRGVGDGVVANVWRMSPIFDN